MRFGVAVIVFCMVCRLLPVFADDVDRVPGGHLRFDMYLYFWPAGLDGSVSAGTHRADTNIRFREIIDDLKMGANGAWKISKDQWFLFNDFLYLDLAHKTSQSIASIPEASVDVTLTTRVLTDLLVVGRQWQEPVEWNVFVGARYMYGKIRLDAIEQLGPFHREALLVKSKEWVTPTIGAGVRIPFNNKLSLNLTGDVGALEGSFNWEAVPVFSWKFNDTLSAEVGYRLLDVRHKEDDFTINTLMHGPVFGAKISF